MKAEDNKLKSESLVSYALTNTLHEPQYLPTGTQAGDARFGFPLSTIFYKSMLLESIPASP